MTHNPFTKTILASMLLTCLAAFAQDHPFESKGPSRDALSSIDSVNPSNGNGFMSIPIGQTYHIGGKVTLQLTLNYNSKVWQTISGVLMDEIVGNYPTAFPSRKSNAGVGWRLSLGELAPPQSPRNPSQGTWMFIDSSGGEHLFHNTLHNGLAPDGAQYTRDGSYIRMQTEGPFRLVELPNGLVYRFDGQNRLERIYDALGPDINALYFRYEDGGDTQVIEQIEWQNNEPIVQRTWKIYYEDFVLPAELYPSRYDEEDRTIRFISKVALPGFDGQQIDWDFHVAFHEVGLGCAVGGSGFDTTPLPFLERVELPSAGGSAARQSFEILYNLGQVITGSCETGALTSVRLPSGGKIEWAYKQSPPVLRRHCETPEYGPFFWKKSNWIESRTYRDLDGSVLAHWEYDYHVSEPPQPTPVDHRCDWYNQTATGGGDPEADYASEVLTSIETNPLGDKVFRVHAIWPMAMESEHGYGPRDYGTPILRPGVDTGTSILSLESDRVLSAVDLSDPAPEGQKRHLSSVYYRATNDGFKTYKAVYKRYEASAGPLDGGPQEFSAGEDFQRNARLISQKTIYPKLIIQDRVSNHPDTAQVIYREKFDGLGNFRRVRMLGYPTLGQGDPLDESRFSKRTTETDFNPGTHDLVLNQDGLIVHPSSTDLYEIPSVSLPWILNTYTEEMVSAPGEGAHITEVQFDRNTGLLLKKRVWADNDGDPERSSQDILNLYTYQKGQVEEVATFGGAGAPIDLDPLPSLNPAGDDYEQKTQFEYDPISKIVVSEALIGAPPDRRRFVKYHHEVVDPNTGLVIETKDEQGVLTRKAYDDLNRITSIEVPTEQESETVVEPINIIYEDFGQHPRYSVEVSQELSGNPQKRERLEHDGFGRVVTSKQWMLRPGETPISQRIYKYGSNGLLAQVSTPHFEDVPPKWTEFSNYHPTLRPQKVEGPEGSVITEILSNEVFQERRKIAVEKDLRVGKDLEGHPPDMDDWPEQIEVKRGQWYDFLGRLRKVEERSQNGTDFSVGTQYSYNVDGKLTRAETLRANKTDEKQIREWSFNGLGFLKSHTYPELHGTLIAEGYDTFGNPTSLEIRDEKDLTIRDLGMSYDGFGRHVLTEDLLAGTILEEMSYGRENDGGNLALHQLVQSKRHNYLLQPDGSLKDVVVTERYRYDDPFGRQTSTTTLVDERGGDGEPKLNGTHVFRAEAEYDRIGRTSHYQAPTLTYGWMGSDQARRIAYAWQYGNLARVSSDAPGDPQKLASFDIYLAHGIPRKTTFFNQVEQLYDLDFSKSGRPGKIYTQGTQQGLDFDTGAFTYDESGNTMKSGDNVFRYDQIGRLTKAEMNFGDGFEVTQQFRYDRFGNRHTDETYPYPASEADNRLIGNVVVGYDEFGNVIRRGPSLYEYDAFDMVQTTRDAGTRTDYVYGPGQERILQEQTRSGYQFWTLRDGERQVVKTYQRTGAQPVNLVKEYVRSGRLGFLTWEKATGAWLVHVQDHLGNVRHVTDGSGQRKAAYDYLAYGELLPHGSNLIDDPLIQFANHESDSARISYMHRRFYDNFDARFMSTDPAQGNAAMPQSWNKYTYALNNPLKYVDPNGESPHIGNYAAANATGNALGRMIFGETWEVRKQNIHRLLGFPEKYFSGGKGQMRTLMYGSGLTSLWNLNSMGSPVKPKSFVTKGSNQLYLELAPSNGMTITSTNGGKDVLVKTTKSVKPKPGMVRFVKGVAWISGIAIVLDISIELYRWDAEQMIAYYTVNSVNLRQLGAEEEFETYRKEAEKNGETDIRVIYRSFFKAKQRAAAERRNQQQTAPEPDGN